MSIWRQMRAIAILPVTATVVIPAVLLYFTGSASVGWGGPMPVRLLPPIVGGGLIAAGLLLAGGTIWLFARAGRGTLAPWDPPRRLVVQGVYCHVRNPMISGVLGVLAGEAILAGSPPLAYWALAFFVLNAIYIALVEEPGLLRRFGGDYATYRENVPRWIPRLRPWTPPGEP